MEMATIQRKRSNTAHIVLNLVNVAAMEISLFLRDEFNIRVSFHFGRP